MEYRVRGLGWVGGVGFRWHLLGLHPKLTLTLAEVAMSQALVSLLRVLVRGYLAVFDAAMRLGPMRGAALLTYGPFVVASAAFLAKVYWLDAVIDILRVLGQPNLMA